MFLQLYPVISLLLFSPEITSPLVKILVNIAYLVYYTGKLVITTPLFFYAFSLVFGTNFINRAYEKIKNYILETIADFPIFDQAIPSYARPRGRRRTRAPPPP